MLREGRRSHDGPSAMAAETVGEKQIAMTGAVRSASLPGKAAALTVSAILWTVLDRINVVE